MITKKMLRIGKGKQVFKSAIALDLDKCLKPDKYRSMPFSELPSNINARVFGNNYNRNFWFKFFGRLSCFLS